MHATTESSTIDGRWLVLIHQIAPEPDYLRVKVRRRLQKLAAVPLKSTVYVLPNRPETLEDFQWLLDEIVADGGEATLCAATLIAGSTDAELEGRFRADRDEAYSEIVRSARDSLKKKGSPDEQRADATRLRRRLEDTRKTDFFDAARRADAEKAIVDLEAAGAAEEAQPRAASTAKPSGRVWVTREGVFVDRIASAWLITRFIDPSATFKFVAGHGYRPRPGEIRFDMSPGEYTHEGDRCTFETLLAKFDVRDAALGTIAEIVHDIDLKDEKYGRAEVGGVAAILGGIAKAHPDDAERLRAGSAVFEGLYAELGRASG